MKKLFLMFLCAQFFFSSCLPTKQLRIVKTHQQVMDEKCSNKAEILLDLGPADRSTDDGRNGEILIFDESYTVTKSRGRSNTIVPKKSPQSSNPYNIEYKPFSNSITTNTSTKSTESKVSKEIIFYINENNECYHWRTSGYDLSQKEYFPLQENIKKNERTRQLTQYVVYSTYGIVASTFVYLFILGLF